MKKLLFLPGWMVWRSRQWVARVLVPGGWLCWWQRWAQRVWPTHVPGRPRLASTAADASLRVLVPPEPPGPWAGRGGALSAERRELEKMLILGPVGDSRPATKA